MDLSKLTIALTEEIGNPELFTGRKRELQFLMDWTDLVKQQVGDSHVLLARKRRGKTALLQRYYNILYTRNDPKIIPFYFRVPEYPITLQNFTFEFYKSLISQYLSFKLRRPELYDLSIPWSRLIELCGDDAVPANNIRNMVPLIQENPGAAWNLVRETGHFIADRKNERIIQIIDEFQYMNEFITLDGETIKLCSAYQKTASSKVSPQIVTGSYIGWLDAIVRRMVGRYSEFRLGPLPHDESIAAVFKYARLFNRPITPDQAAYVAELCYDDPYYISRIFKSPYLDRGQVTPQLARKILEHETRLDGGEITKMWSDYIISAVSRINDEHAKKIVLYLAKHGETEFTRDEIRRNLKLSLTDAQLVERMEKLVRADILARGRSMSHYRGLGDPMFEMVFRRLYEHEIEGIDIETMEAEFERRFSKLERQMRNIKGLAGEEKVRYYLAQAGKNRIDPARLSMVEPAESLPQLGPFQWIRKLSLHPTQNRRIEIDLYARADNPDDPDLAVEVKNWASKVGAADVDKEIANAKEATALLERPVVFIFYSENGFTENQAERLAAAGIPACNLNLLVNVLHP
ncbi:MAG: hypothetical protein QNK37_33840 [Acidobacteriota bacterium]|nr:hypothetical protein [Acidobacteriota bacterium]